MWWFGSAKKLQLISEALRIPSGAWTVGLDAHANMLFSARLDHGARTAYELVMSLGESGEVHELRFVLRADGKRVARCAYEITKDGVIRTKGDPKLLDLVGRVADQAELMKRKGV